MHGPASELAHRLARDAEAVCHAYLSNGRREGGYWSVGDVTNEPGRSLYVRLDGPTSGKGAAGRWTDAATGEHGDMLDLIRLNLGLPTLREALDEARRFLVMPRPKPPVTYPRPAPAPRSSPEAARRLFAMGKPVTGTLSERYLRARGITARLDGPALRHHPACYVPAADESSPQTRPALLSAVTDLEGRITGVQRTWLDPALVDKAPMPTPRRAMGHLLGNGVRLGPVVDGVDVLAAGEGIETMLSLRSVLPRLPAVAALSAGHLAALTLPAESRRLYVVVDDDLAGWRTAERLSERAAADGIEVRPIMARLGDLNEDLRALGPAALLGHVAGQLALEDAIRFAGEVAGESARAV